MNTTREMRAAIRQAIGAAADSGIDIQHATDRAVLVQRVVEALHNVDRPAKHCVDCGLETSELSDCASDGMLRCGRCTVSYSLHGYAQ